MTVTDHTIAISLPHNIRAEWLARMVERLTVQCGTEMPNRTAYRLSASVCRAIRANVMLPEEIQATANAELRACDKEEGTHFPSGLILGIIAAINNDFDSLISNVGMSESAWILSDLLHKPRLGYGGI